MLRVQEITSQEELAQFQGHWQELARHSASGGFTDTCEWTTAWLDCFWRRRPIDFLLFWREQELRGVVPLLVDSHGEFSCRGALVSCVNDYSTRSSVLLQGEPHEVLDTLMSYLSTERRPFRITFPQILDSGVAAQLLPKAASSCGASCVRFAGSSSPIVRVNGHWQAYQATRRRHVIRENRRKVNRVERGHVDRRVLTSRDESDLAMRDILAIEESSWKEEEGTSFTAHQGLAEFYTTLAAHGHRRRAGCTAPSVPGRSSGPRLRHALRERVSGIQETSYDARYRELSPGTALFDFALRDAFASGVEVFDLLGSTSRWKEELANDQRRHITLCVFSQKLLPLPVVSVV